MSRLNALIQRSPTAFGRRPVAIAIPVPAEPSSTLGDDLRLFAAFFLGGFVFMSVYLA